MIEYDDVTGESAEYAEFIEKFKPKKTTDDCFTPGNIYEAVKAWAVNEYGLQGRPVIRPFYPGGDYESEYYPDGAVVIDNPPFSILSKILAYYDFIGVDYFLFSPSLTAFSNSAPGRNFVLSDSNITYANGACVRTAFITNLGNVKVLTCPELHDALEAAERENENTAGRSLPKYTYPPQVISAATLQKLASHGVRLELKEDDLTFTRRLDAQRPSKKAIFGGGFILTEAATQAHLDALRQAEENDARRAAELFGQGVDVNGAIMWQLSEREWELVRR